MNWLIYIAGWFWGWGITNVLMHGDEKHPDAMMTVKLIVWTMTWIWICWRFIR